MVVAKEAAEPIAADDASFCLPDLLGTLSRTITVGESISVSDIDVALSIEYIGRPDFTIVLQAPGGSAPVTLYNGDSTALRGSFVGTLFDDDGIASIRYAGDVKKGRYLPHDSLATPPVANAQGPWTLTIAGGEIPKTLRSWSLSFNDDCADDCRRFLFETTRFGMRSSRP